MTTPQEAAERGFSALTTGFHDSEAALMEAVCGNLRRGGIPFVLVTVGHGVREVWRKDMKVTKQRGSTKPKLIPRTY
jgi:hypothetical protein